MKDYKVIKYPNPVDIPLTCRCLDKGGPDVYWIHDKSKTIYVFKKPWYSDKKKHTKRRPHGITHKKKGN